MSQKLVRNNQFAYTILLVVFAILVVGLLIDSGPPFQEIQPDATVVAILGEPLFGDNASPTQIFRYGLTQPATGATLFFDRRIDGTWQQAGASDQPIDQDAAEIGANIIFNFRLFRVLRYNSETNFSEYGLGQSPQYVVSYITNAYNSRGDVQEILVYIGNLNPTQDFYYAVVDATQGVRFDEWVYQIPSDDIDALVNTMSSASTDSGLVPQQEDTTP